MPRRPHRAREIFKGIAKRGRHKSSRHYADVHLVSSDEEDDGRRAGPATGRGGPTPSASTSSPDRPTR